MQELNEIIKMTREAFQAMPANECGIVSEYPASVYIAGERCAEGTMRIQRIGNSMLALLNRGANTEVFYHKTF
jgi:hypothetical protein